MNSISLATKGIISPVKAVGGGVMYREMTKKEKQVEPPTIKAKLITDVEEDNDVSVSASIDQQ